MNLDEMKKLTGPMLRKDVAQILGCDLRTVDRALSDGTIKSFNVGRRVFIPVKPFVKLIESGDSGES
jgi:hypothetical protein